VTTKILIVDDHPLVRDALTLLVGALPGGAKIFTASNAAQALEQAEFHTPLDAILLDCGLPDADGGSLIRALQTRAGGAPVIVVSANESDESVARMLNAGASAFVPKSKASSNILSALKLAMAQGKSAHASVGAVPTSSASPNTGTTPAGKPPVLTARQLDILLMMDQGLSNNSISLNLGLSEKTVKNHITALFSALGAVNRMQATRHARNLRLLV
jgi:two-component system, NarL family, nitrate/nitrite response regulator NarL